MLIAQVIAGAQAGGAELFFERLCAGLHDSGEAILPVIRRDAARAARLRQAGLAPRELRFGGALDLLTRRRLRRLLRLAAPAVVMTWMGRAAAVTPAGPWTLVGRLGGYYDLKRFRRCQHLVGNTRDIAGWIAGQGWPESRVHYLPNFVPDLRGAAPADRAPLGVPAGAPLLLAMGRLHPAKGFDVLVRALPRLPDAHLVIAGEGGERAALTALAADLGVEGRVHLPGWREDSAALLAACDIFVCPSRHEPLGNVVLEAWSAGKPVVAAAAQGPGALIRDGVDGCLAPVEDNTALAKSIAAMLNTTAVATTLAAAGRERYEREFAEAEVITAWRRFFHAVAP